MTGRRNLFPAVFFVGTLRGSRGLQPRFYIKHAKKSMAIREGWRRHKKKEKTVNDEKNE